MIVYHGSVTEVITPDISFSRCNLDFGKASMSLQSEAKLNVGQRERLCD